jgi:hypothetical protein
VSSDFPLAGPLIIQSDNNAALSLCLEHKEGQRAKHIDVIHHFARERVASGELQYVYCKSEDTEYSCCYE